MPKQSRIVLPLTNAAGTPVASAYRADAFMDTLMNSAEQKRTGSRFPIGNTYMRGGYMYYAVGSLTLHRVDALPDIENGTRPALPVALSLLVGVVEPYVDERMDGVGRTFWWEYNEEASGRIVFAAYRTEPGSAPTLVKRLHDAFDDVVVTAVPDNPPPFAYRTERLIRGD